MRAHERADHSHHPRRARRSRPRPGPTTEVDDPDVARILALQRTVGNAATINVLSGQHAGSTAVPVQRVGDGVADRERRLSEEFGIRIGPAGRDGKHFTHKELDRIESALRGLPREDVALNQELQAIEIDPTPEGSASLYTPTTRSVRIVRPRLPGPFPLRAPGLLYASLNRGSDWQRVLMDQEAMAGYEGISREGDRALGIPGGARRVMGTQGNLLKWTLRHEVGHAVDAQAGWLANLAGETHFGGWRTYEDTRLEEVATAILGKAELYDVLTGFRRDAAVTTLASYLVPEQVRENVADEESGLERFFERFRRALNADEFAERKATALRFIRFAIAQPWTLDDGAAEHIGVEDRVYQMDQYDTWVSYEGAQRRQYKVSNYQFSSPAEWFAEAYSTFYDAKRQGELTKIHPQAQAWFATLPRR
jgi:hypothetical protein